MKLLRNYLISVLALAVLCGAVVGIRWIGGANRSFDFLCLGSSFSDGGSASAAKIFRSVWAEAEPSALPEEAAGTDPVIFTAWTKDGEKTGEYSLFVLSMMDRVGYAVAGDGACRRLSVTGFSGLLSDPLFWDLPAERLPVFSVTLEADKTTVLGAEISRHLFCWNPSGGLTEVSRVGESDPIEIKVDTVFRDGASGLRIAADPPADRYACEFYRDGIPTGSVKTADPQALPDFPEPGEYLCTLTAIWDLTPERDWYGEVAYEFHFTVAKPEDDLSDAS